LYITAVLGEFGKLLKTNINYDMSVLLYGLIRLSIEKKFNKSDIRIFF